ncbi:MAG: bifunctional oligoribonuclease/PAP phosphatase NrnA [Planctomycetes bacterium]|nr:bifunctional oligoribonuclease/PAP phosphatase NrnA [Planctomycetota bacterium]
MSIPWHEFKALLAKRQRVLLTSHVRPDCDALGSELGMAGVLEALGKQVRIVNGQATPPNLAFIDPGRRIEVLGEVVTAKDLDDRELLIILDTSAWAQLGPMGEVVRGTAAFKAVVDHHVSQDELGAEPFKDTSSESTGRLVLEFAKYAQVPLTPAIATPLFAAMATDTGWFRFRSAGSVAYRAAAELIDAGADPAVIFSELYEQDTLARVRLRGLILCNVRNELEGRLAHTCVRLADFQETGALPSDTEDVINMLLAIRGTEVAVIFVEQQSGAFKISFRSRCSLDCNQLAARFGGGGHKAAAGAMIAGTYADVAAKVLDAVRGAMT